MTHECDHEDDSQWRLLPGMSSGCSGESKFECIHCGDQWFRGGMASAVYLEPHGVTAKLHSELLADARKRAQKVLNPSRIQRFFNWWTK